MQLPYSLPSYRRSRTAYAAQCTVTYFVDLLIADAFLTKLLKYIGLSDASTGVIASLAALAFLSELATLPLVNRVTHPKRTVIGFETTGTLLMALLFLLPVLPFSSRIKTVLAVCLIMGGLMLRRAVSSLHYVWGNSSVEPGRLARFTAVKEIFSLVLGMVFSLTVGLVFEKYERSGDLAACFTLISAVIICLNILCFACFMSIRSQERKVSEYVRIVSTAKTIFRLPAFRMIRLATCIWYAATYFTSGFLGTYKLQELGFSVVDVQLINIVSCAVRVIASAPIGRYSDRTSFAQGSRLALLLAALAFGINAFTAPGTRYLILVYTVLMGAAMAGINGNLYNILFSYLDGTLLVPAMAIRNGICGLAGFLSSLAGGRIVSNMQSAGNHIFGINIYPQQLLSAVSFILVCLTVFIVRRRICTLNDISKSDK